MKSLGSFLVPVLLLAFLPSRMLAEQGIQEIRHIVVIFQENRTPDNLFHGLPNADIANSGINSQGERIRLKPLPLASDYNVWHDHDSFISMYDSGKMDGADKIPVACGNINPNCLIPPNPQFKYVIPSNVAPYFQLAKQYTFADRMFQTNQGPSFPAHQYIIAGTSAPAEDSPLFVSENPHEPGQKLPPAGCTAPLDVTVHLIDPTGDESQEIYPCFEHPTLMDLLDNAGLSWRYYSPGQNSIWTAPNAIAHLRFGSDWSSHVILDPREVLKDITRRQLPAVSWVVPKGQYSDHAGNSDSSGPSWVASIVNAIGKSQYWSSTAIFITWDDWGGWYDHVAPKIINAYEYGFRVPLIVVSPYAKPGYVSHVTHDFGSILKFVERVYDLPTLGYADQESDDLLDCFSFGQTPLKFRTIDAPYDANYFLTDTRAASSPDED